MESLKNLDERLRRVEEVIKMLVITAAAHSELHASIVDKIKKLLEAQDD